MVLGVIAATLIGACGGGEEGGSGSVAEAIGERCNWESDGAENSVPPSAAEITDAFVAAGSNDVRLLLETDEVRPGDTFEITVANDSAKPVLYGEGNQLEHAETGDPVVVPGPLVAEDVGLEVRPRDVGPCVTVFVPTSTAEGRYRVVLGAHRPSSDRSNETLEAEITVSGDPIDDPSWEEELRAQCEDLWESASAEERSDPISLINQVCVPGFGRPG